MFKRSKKISSSKTHSFSKLITTPKIVEMLKIPETISPDPFDLTDESYINLKNYLQDITSEADFRLKYSKELQTTEKRSKQLEETKRIVYSLRETDQTSDKALDFLKEKLDLLINEQADLAMKLLAFQEKLPLILINELEQQIETFLGSITFLETDSWEEDLDYYRTRFLMQREQEDIDEQLKQEFIPEDILANYDPLAKPRQKPTPRITKPVIMLKMSKKQSQESGQLIKDFNHLTEQIPNEYLDFIFETSIETLKEKFPEQEKLSFDTGKEMYTLKREQGIMTLKTYEIVQTLRSRLLNISGSIASRVFLKKGFNELITHIQNNALTEEEKRLTLHKEINRLLRILGELKPGEGI
ncbi:MAG: hypothetical protein FK730_05365 [Asgard group archaeon]|nr:hypothetical protein [Asgard group archaeon]